MTTHRRLTVLEIAQVRVIRYEQLAAPILTSILTSFLSAPPHHPSFRQCLLAEFFYLFLGLRVPACCSEHQNVQMRVTSAARVVVAVVVGIVVAVVGGVVGVAVVACVRRKVSQLMSTTRCDR